VRAATAKVSAILSYQSGNNVMSIKTPNNILLARFVIVTVAALLCIPANAQAPERTPYSAPPDWTVTTYRAADTKVFLRCSAERHYDDGLTLTIAKTNAGKFVLGFTSSDWTYEDRSTQPVSIQIDSGEETSLSGRVRLLPSGPIVFVDIEADSTVISAISAGNVLFVNSGETSLDFDLSGSAVAVSSTEQCHRDGSD